MYCYCLFCETVHCDDVARHAETKFDCRAISPKQVQHIRRHGAFEDISHPLLPGYVFLYFDGPVEDTAMFRRLPGVLKCLKETEKQAELSGSDEAFAMMLYEKNGVIGKTEVYAEGEKIRLKEGAFSGMEAEIVRVDRRAVRMQILLTFAGRPLRTWVEYEIVEKTKDETNAQTNA
ncbi:MAG: hypothetical protein II875_01260 [Clostridia bacterium]|nr:hypothetical protein [Clostridia bacterium]